MVATMGQRKRTQASLRFFFSRGVAQLARLPQDSASFVIIENYSSFLVKFMGRRPARKFCTERWEYCLPGWVPLMFLCLFIQGGIFEGSESEFGGGADNEVLQLNILLWEEPNNRRSS